MADSNSLPDLVHKVVAALESRLGVARCDDVAALRKRATPDGPGFVTNARIRIGNYYDMQPAIAVYDPGLGTLAFVEHVSRSQSAPEDAAWGAIERATAVRQILIDDAMRQSRDGTRTLPLQVELVLLVSSAVQGKTPDPIRVTLTKVARQTGYLRLIGLSVLDSEQHPDLDDAVLRRAFAWLLKGTTAWFNRPAFQPGVSTWRAGTERLELRLQDYRMSGTRRFSCRGTAWLNLVHGHNGSGKSSIAEAVELLLTDRIQRLDDAGEANYFRVVRHRPAGVLDANLASLDPCEVAMWGNEAVTSSVRIEHGSKPVRGGAAPMPGIQVNSFRLDQVFMDKLIRTQAAGRAALFLNAFSPSDAALLGKLQQLKLEMRREWANLPEHLRKKAELQVVTPGAADPARAHSGSTLTEEEMAAFVIRELGALQEAAPAAPGEGAKATEKQGQPELVPGVVEGLLPVDKSEIARLAQIYSPILERMNALLAVRDAASLRDKVAQFQSSLNSLTASLPLQIADLGTSLRVFQEFRSWNAGKRTVAGDFETDLRAWLELQALLDLTARYADVVTTVDAARVNKWPSDARGIALATLVPSGTPDDLVTRKAELGQALSEARGRVESPQESTVDTAGSKSTQQRRWLSPSEVESLNRAGQFLLSTGGTEPLGVRFNRALANGKEEKLADGTIGRAGGLDHAIEEAAELARACERLQQANVSWGTAGADVLQRTGTMVRAARALQALASELPQSFFHRLAQGNKQELNELIAAFNELLALITPARWAYRDIQISPDLPDGDPALGLQTSEGAPADLLFNTSELNASALVLFLLLAPRLPNDLRLLVLDDPLQNMDELTVVTLGRALAKLRVIYPRDWMMLAFFHGEENVQRLRDEAHCHVYHLPWLQSSGAGEGEEPIESATTQDAADWQPLSQDLVADPPPPRQAHSSSERPPSPPFEVQ